MFHAALTERLSGATALGVAFTLASAISMSWLGILSQLAYDAGASVGTLLSGRFLVAAILLWAIVSMLGSRRPSRRQLVAGLALGAGYSIHAWLFSESLARLDAGLVDLFLFTYPVLVMVGAVALGREHVTVRRMVALGAVTIGAAVVLLGGLRTIDLLGAGLALGAAVAYSGYILLSSDELKRTDPLLLTALVTTGAGTTLTVGAFLRGEVAFTAGAEAYVLVAVVGLVAVAGMTTFVAGIGRLGPARASIVSAVQPAITPVIGYTVFADRLGVAQALGGALVFVGVVILEGKVRSSRPTSGYRRLPRRERIALRRFARPAAVSAGEPILRQDAAADGFYLVVRGRARVTRDDRVVGDLGAGDFFGEIALLERGRRTASVVASTDLSVRVIPRRDFLAAMRYLPTLAERVRNVARERIATPQTLPSPGL